MRFKDFVTKQRIFILVVGIIIFWVSVVLAKQMGSSTTWGELFIDLAASSVTIVFTALIIDYLGLREQTSKTRAAADLAEEEVKAICFRIKFRMARLFGFEQDGSVRDQIATQEDARKYLNKANDRIDNFLSEQDFDNKKAKLDYEAFSRYMDRIQAAQNELEQMLILYEYALSYSLREHILSLRRELLLSERLLGFIDTSEPLNQANLSLIRLTSKSIYSAVEAVLGHDSAVNNTSIGEK